MTNTRRQSALCNYMGGMALLDEQLDNLVGNLGFDSLWHIATKAKDDASRVGDVARELVRAFEG